MLVYGDASRRVDPRAALTGIVGRLERAVALSPGRERHEALVAAFIEASALVQGLADENFRRRGRDGDPGPHDAATTLLVKTARLVGSSWRSGFDVCEPPPLAEARHLAETSLPGEIEIRTPEGYAFYATYPEGWFEAAMVLKPRRVQAIGIRSIGAGLAAMIAAATDGPPPLTVRPFGPPFRRKITLAPSAIASLRTEPDLLIAVADEGPGLSGSSFAAVATFLEAEGVDPARLHFFPSHPGDPGHEADPAWRARWPAFPRTFRSLDALILDGASPAHRLETWTAALTGAPIEAIEDVSAGLWRRRFSAAAERELPALPRGERRKFLVRSDGKLWLAKFVGLGQTGVEKLRMARALHAAGYVPEPRGLAHGFLLERWRENAYPLRAPPRGDRAGLIAFLGDYLGFRAAQFPAAPGAGASLKTLYAMAQRNAGASLECRASERLAALAAKASEMEPLVRRVRTDGRLHLWEWLATPDGRLLKADALDHHASHDLIGCQDVAWDVAGAACEFALNADETAALADRVAHAAERSVASELVAAYAAPYLAFHIGLFRLAERTEAGTDEAPRLAQLAERYVGRLRTMLGATP